ncbi:MAG: phage protein GemA/Gp16 family protein [Syntrophobacteraceae bacterium]
MRAKRDNEAAEVDRRGLLARVHILAHEAGLADDLYRSCLLEWTGKESCRDMDDRELGVVVMRLLELKENGGRKSEGGDRRAKGGSREWAASQTDYPPGCTPEQWRKMRWLQRQLRWNDKNLRGYMKHVAGVEHERFLDVPMAREIIAGMVKVRAFEERKLLKEAIYD